MQNCSKETKLTSSTECWPQLAAKYFIIETDAEDILKVSTEVMSERVNRDGTRCRTSGYHK